MKGLPCLLGTSGGGGGSSAGSMSTVSKEDSLVVSSEVCSSYPDESDLELGLGLSLGGALKSRYGRILKAEDFPSLVSNSPSSSSSSSSSSSTKVINTSSAGTKRTAADSVSPPNGNSQVVGWPPIRAYRMNSLFNQAKSRNTEGFSSAVEENKCKNGSNKNNNAIEKGLLKTTLFVKVNMDGIPIGRKVDLNAHSCYKTLAQTLDDMFCRPTATISGRWSSLEVHDAITEATEPSKLLVGSSEFVLTYEDKEGDWMLVGDVPWGMFIGSVKRLRIMRTSEANGVAPRCEERNGRQRTEVI